MEKSMRIEERLTKAFLKVAILTLIGAAVTLIALGVTSNRYTYALKHYGFAQGDIGNAMLYFADARSATKSAIGYLDQSAISEAEELHDEMKTEFESYFALVESGLVSDSDFEIYNRIKSNLEEYWSIDTEVNEIGATADADATAKAQEIAIEQLDPLYLEIFNDFENLMANNVEQGDRLDNTLNTLVVIIIVVVVIIVAAIFYISLHIGKSVSKQISNPLNTMADRLKHFSEGDLSSEFPDFETKDEIHDMAVVAGSMAENLHIIMDDLNMGLQAIASGNFLASSAVPEKYVGDFEKMRIALETFIADMRETLLKIDEAAEQVDAGSCQLAESAIELAEGATDQAGAIQEVTATITQIADNAQKTANEVDEAYQNGLKYRTQAENSNKEMDNLAIAMERISEASEQIRNIIAEIEDIAAQTNLLSLNASIEAARAGEAGRGFAVVADQIGKLATDSAQSAVRTKELIQHALAEVENGNEITQNTKRALEEVVEGIEFLSNASRHASESSALQVVSLREVELAIDQISGVVQSNSAAAEETSATSEELAAQATSLRDLVNNFQVR